MIEGILKGNVRETRVRIIYIECTNVLDLCAMYLKKITFFNKFYFDVINHHTNLMF